MISAPFHPSSLLSVYLLFFHSAIRALSGHWWCYGILCRFCCSAAGSIVLPLPLSSHGSLPFSLCMHSFLCRLFVSSGTLPDNYAVKITSSFLHLTCFICIALLTFCKFSFSYLSSLCPSQSLVTIVLGLFSLGPFI